MLRTESSGAGGNVAENPQALRTGGSVTTLWTGPRAGTGTARARSCSYEPAGTAAPKGQRLPAARHAPRSVHRGPQVPQLSNRSLFWKVWGRHSDPLLSRPGGQILGLATAACGHNGTEVRFDHGRRSQSRRLAGVFAPTKITSKNESPHRKPSLLRVCPASGNKAPPKPGVRFHLCSKGHPRSILSLLSPVNLSKDKMPENATCLESLAGV